MRVTQHIETIGSEFFGSESYAECSCGFKGLIRENELKAAQDLIDHRKNWKSSSSILDGIVAEGMGGA